MEAELLKIFNEQHQEIGTATREEVHRKGYWHETFHCWLTSQENGVDYIYFQIRSPQKKDYPNMIDITAAGHLLATETVQDGLRELEEEIGIAVTFDELLSLGLLKYCVTKENFIDNELAHAFLYRTEHSLEQFKLQEEEVSGIARATFESFCQLWSGAGSQEDITLEGFEIDDAGNKVFFEQKVSKARFVPHEQVYYEQIIDQIQQQLVKG